MQSYYSAIAVILQRYYSAMELAYFLSAIGVPMLEKYHATCATSYNELSRDFKVNSLTFSYTLFTSIH